MKKDFKKWHSRKEYIHEEKARPFFREREVWFCALGVNVGFEQDGRGDSFLRPVLITKKFNNESFWGIPLTKNQKEGKYYFSFGLNREISTAIISQIRLIDAKRLYYKTGTISEKDFSGLIKKLKALLP